MDISLIQKTIEKDGIVFLTYGGFLSQPLIASMMGALEKETETNELSMGVSNNIFTIFIELSQNMMNYSKSSEENSNDPKPEGLLVVSRDEDKNYMIDSQNIISLEDKQKIEPRLIEVQSLNKASLKKRYRELRRSGREKHAKGGGIGFFEIAKRCDKIEFDMKKINENKFYFHITTYIQSNKEKEEV